MKKITHLRKVILMLVMTITQQSSTRMMMKMSMLTRMLMPMPATVMQLIPMSFALSTIC